MSKQDRIPQHVAIIMDGNGRWAKQHGLDRIFGHIQGVDSVRSSIEACLDYGIRYLTMYVFSTENWGRPQEEVDALMELFCDSVMRETPRLQEKGVQVRVIGEKGNLSDKVLESLRWIEAQTAAGDRLSLILALNYSSRNEITDAVREIARRTAVGEMAPEAIDQLTIAENLQTAPAPDPDMIIRTSGECRLSNFLLWQSAYSELYFTEVFWPDFNREEFDKAMQAYAGRERRYGLVNEK